MDASVLARNDDGAIAKMAGLQCSSQTSSARQDVTHGGLTTTQTCSSSTALKDNDNLSPGDSCYIRRTAQYCYRYCATILVVIHLDEVQRQYRPQGTPSEAPMNENHSS